MVVEEMVRGFRKTDVCSVCTSCLLRSSAGHYSQSSLPTVPSSIAQDLTLRPTPTHPESTIPRLTPARNAETGFKMPLEATMIVVDNSEASRNGDYM
jgi:hypothetical protein